MSLPLCVPSTDCERSAGSGNCRAVGGMCQLLFVFFLWFGVSFQVPPVVLAV